MSPDFKEMLSLLEKHQVEYLIVGGYAVIRHTQPRYTKDLDIWVRPNRENAAKTANALREFGVPLIEVTEEDFSQEGLQFAIGLPPNCIDFLTSIKGLEFAPAWNNRMTCETSSGPIHYASPGDMIIAKQAAGRLQDLADVEEILRLHPDAGNHPRKNPPTP